MHHVPRCLFEPFKAGQIFLSFPNLHSRNLQTTYRSHTLSSRSFDQTQLTTTYDITINMNANNGKQPDRGNTAGSSKDPNKPPRKNDNPGSSKDDSRLTKEQLEDLRKGAQEKGKPVSKDMQELLARMEKTRRLNEAMDMLKASMAASDDDPDSVRPLLPFFSCSNVPLTKSSGPSRGGVGDEGVAYF